MPGERAVVTHLGELKTNNLDMPLVAYELRSSLDFIDTILGKTTADDILNNVFSKFCVGK